MTAKSYCRLAALILAVVAALQLIRAVSGWPITVGATTSIPLWASWVVGVIAGVLAWIGLMHLDNKGDEMHFNGELWVISRHNGPLNVVLMD